MKSNMKATVYMLALFCSGAVCGAVAMHHYQPVPPPPQTLRLGRVDEIYAKIVAKFQDRLQLNHDQLSKADPFIRVASQKLEDAHATCLKQIEAAIAQLHHDVRPLLNDDQVSKLAIMDKERADSLWQKYNFCAATTNGTGN